MNFGLFDWVEHSERLAPAQVFVVEFNASTGGFVFK